MTRGVDTEASLGRESSEGLDPPVSLVGSSVGEVKVICLVDREREEEERYMGLSRLPFNTPGRATWRRRVGRWSRRRVVATSWNRRVILVTLQSFFMRVSLGWGLSESDSLLIFEGQPRSRLYS